MGNNRNPGLLAVVVGVALGVLFALLGVTGVFDGRIGFGLAAICLVVSALIYIFYSRGSTVEKTGYGALLFVIATAFIIPLLTVNQQQAQATATTDLYQQKLQNGAALYGQYCASCHGFQGQGINGPKLNNNPAVNKLSTDDLTRIISGGIPADPANPTVLAMPSWSDQYGGSLSEVDISYLVALIQSSNKSYLATQGLPNSNGFNYVLASLTNPTQIAEYKSEKASGSAPPASAFTDLTSQKTVVINAENTTGGAVSWGWVAVGADPSHLQGGNNAIIKIKAGTKVTWGNKSSQIHNLVSGANGTPNNKFPGYQNALAANSTDTYSYTFSTPGTYPFYCGFHPGMIGYIEVVP